MILQWHRQRDSSYTARWNGINFLLDLDEETARWVCRANGHRLTIHKRVQTWGSPIAAMEHMDRVQTAILRARQGVGLFRRPAAPAAALAAPYGVAKSQVVQGEVGREIRRALIERPSASELGVAVHRAAAHFMDQVADAAESLKPKPMTLADFADLEKRLKAHAPPYGVLAQDASGVRHATTA
jgi:hypothetical protein